jgi:hypothetical protein
LSNREPFPQHYNNGPARQKLRRRINMTVGDVARVNLLQAFKGNRVITGFNIRMATSAGTLGDLASDVVSSILPSFIPAVTQDLGVIAVEVQDVVPGVAETVEHTITGNLVGEFVSPSAPPQVAACLSIHCGIKSKRARGRMFVSGLPAEFVIAGTISGQRTSRRSATP